MEDLAIDIFYWFDKSTKRKASLQSYCVFCDTSYREVIKHVSTRWLSLERAVARILEKYIEMQSYFSSEGITCYIISMYVLFLAMQMRMHLDIVE